MKKKKKTIKELKQIRKKNPLTCGKCKLWDFKEGVCKVVVIDKGEKFELQTKANDPCKWEQMGVDVQRMRIYSDGKNGTIEWTENENTDRGIDPITDRKI